MSDRQELSTADANPERCETCRFWEDSRREYTNEDVAHVARMMKISEDDARRTLADEDGVIPEGFCHRYPPQVVLDGGQYDARQPNTQAEHWCGEWRAKAATPAELLAAIRRQPPGQIVTLPDPFALAVDASAYPHGFTVETEGARTVVLPLSAQHPPPPG